MHLILIKALTIILSNYDLRGILIFFLESRIPKVRIENETNHERNPLQFRGIGHVSDAR